jgi:hypothetical protein
MEVRWNKGNNTQTQTSEQQIPDPAITTGICVSAFENLLALMRGPAAWLYRGLNRHRAPVLFDLEFIRTANTTAAQPVSVNYVIISTNSTLELHGRERSHSDSCERACTLIVSASWQLRPKTSRPSQRLSQYPIEPNSAKATEGERIKAKSFLRRTYRLPLTSSANRVNDSNEMRAN